MLDYKINDLLPILKSKNTMVGIHGAGNNGCHVNYALRSKGIKVDFFLDSDNKKHGLVHDGIKTLSNQEFENTIKDKHNCYVFIAHNFIEPVVKYFKSINFSNIFNSLELLQNTNFSEGNEYSKKYPSFTPLIISRYISNHKYSVLKLKEKNKFVVKHIDVMITERCSMKCKDCSNLMQFYHKGQAQNGNTEIILRSIERLMKNLDGIGEFRVIGGEPFMNKEIHKIVNKLATYKQVDKIVVYTNATIIPKGDNLECLKHKNVFLEITNYGPKLSKNHDNITKLFDENGITYMSERVKLWDDIGKLEYRKRKNSEVQEVFNNCCANDLFTLMDGILYKCPVSANGTKLKAVPFDPKYDGIHILHDDISDTQLKEKLIDFYTNSKFVTACHYCKGRGFGFGEIEAAIQTKEPLEYVKVS